MGEWFTIEKIDDTTYAISEYGHWEQVHSYLLMGKEYACLIDTGLGIDNIKKVTEDLTDLPVKIITTHVHWDHTGGHRFFDEIYVHKEEAQCLRYGIPLPLEKIREYVSGPLTKKLPEDFNIENYFPYKGEPAGELQDNDILSIGSRNIKIIHTPGHSPGHICLYEEERGYLYTGDLLYKGTLFAFYPSTDPLQFCESVEKISKIQKLEKILPGHNDLNIDRNYLEEVRKAFIELKTMDLLKHGTGLHDFGNVKIRF
jgi:glyoxylase-like metal-dependent hydrolase (beta-lactamase superfamily II)